MQPLLETTSSDDLIEPPAIVSVKRKASMPEAVEPTRLKDGHTIKWLKTRHAHKIQPEYFFNQTESNRWKELRVIFSRYDLDNGGSLDIKELKALLKKSALVFTPKTTRELFKLIDKDKSGYLSLDEFQTLIMDHTLQTQFRNIMKEVRNDTYSTLNRGQTTFVPLTFEALLHYLFMRDNRDLYMKQANEGLTETFDDKVSQQQKQVKVKGYIENFMYLFGLEELETTDYQITHKYLIDHEKVMKECSPKKQNARRSSDIQISPPPGFLTTPKMKSLRNDKLMNRIQERLYLGSTTSSGFRN